MATRELIWSAALLLALAGCSREGDDGYTALVRYNVTDFRIAAIDARPADPSQPARYAPGQQIALRAVVLATSDDPIEIEWIDCAAYVYGGRPSSPELMGSANVDCLGTPQERRLGRGETASYTLGSTAAPMPERDAAWPWEGGWPLDGGWPQWDAALTDITPYDLTVPLTEYEDATIFVRATQGDRIRYGRKNFFGVFDPLALVPAIESLQVDGAARASDDPGALVRKPKAALAIRFTVRNVIEHRMVQWFVSGGSLDQHGLTYYVEASAATDVNPYAVAENVWQLPEQGGRQQLIAVVGGNYGPLPYVRINVEVTP